MLDGRIEINCGSIVREDFRFQSISCIPNRETKRSWRLCSEMVPFLRV